MLYSSVTLGRGLLELCMLRVQASRAHFILDELSSLMLRFQLTSPTWRKVMTNEALFAAECAIDGGAADA